MNGWMNGWMDEWMNGWMDGYDVDNGRDDLRSYPVFAISFYSICFVSILTNLQ